MMIISQDKSRQVFTENIECLEYTGGEIVANGVDDNYYELGTYTEERAEEVFQEIQMVYAASEMVKMPSLNLIQPMSGTDVSQLLYYEMPKE